jgi:hypothetical protein
MDAEHRSLRTEAPAENRALRDALYDGAIFLLDETDAAEALVEAAREVVVAELGDAPRLAHERFDDVELFELVGRARRTLYMERRYHEMVREVIAAPGFDPGRVAFDPARLRVILHAGHTNPRAASVYYAHRDTWYGHPQSLITWWLPLDDLGAEETFVFYPERFDEPVPNDSEIFDYDEWVRRGWSLKIGWQDRDAGIEARYPGVTEEVDPGSEVAFRCHRGQNLLFSGAHFHQTREQALGTTRFSLDFRIVHLDDVEAGRGAPNVDSRARGTALGDYVHPGAEGAW